MSEHGFVRVNPHGRVLDVENVYAAGDCTEFPVKHGGVGAQQADVVAQSIAARAGAPVAAELFHPVIRGMLLTGDKPLYLTARIAGGHGFSSEITDSPTWDPPNKIVAKYLARPIWTRATASRSPPDEHASAERADPCREG